MAPGTGRPLPPSPQNPVMKCPGCPVPASPGAGAAKTGVARQGRAPPRGPDWRPSAGHTRPPTGEEGERTEIPHLRSRACLSKFTSAPLSPAPQIGGGCSRAHPSKSPYRAPRAAASRPLRSSSASSPPPHTDDSPPLHRPRDPSLPRMRSPRAYRQNSSSCRQARRSLSVLRLRVMVRGKPQ